MSFKENVEVISKTLKYLDSWDMKTRLLAGRRKI